MNKRSFTVTLVISILIIPLLGGLQTDFVKADPFWVVPPPVIHFSPLEGHLYSENTVTISFYVETSPGFVECSNFRCWLDGKLMEPSAWLSYSSVNLTGLSDGQKP